MLRKGECPVNQKLTDLSALAGRTLLSLIFILSGIHKLLDWPGSKALMAAQEMPMIPFFLACATFAELAGGLSVLTGYRARQGALLLFAYLIPVTLVFHHFWDLEGPDRQIQLINFMKNVSIMGGLALTAGFGPGRKTLRLRHRPQPERRIPRMPRPVPAER